MFSSPRRISGCGTIDLTRRENTRTMDSKLRKILTDCIGDIETGARDVEGCLQRHPDRAAELRPHLELWSHLSAAPKAEPNFGSRQRGKQQLLGALSDMERGTYKGKMIPAVAKVAVVMAAASWRRPEWRSSTRQRRTARKVGTARPPLRSCFWRFARHLTYRYKPTNWIRVLHTRTILKITPNSPYEVGSVSV